MKALPGPYIMLPRLLVLLAAGLGTRIGGDKQFLEVEGKPLSYYPLVVSHLLGVSEAVIVTRVEIGSEMKKLAESIYGSGSVYIVINREIWRENGYSLLLAGETLGWTGRVLVSMADHVYTPLVPIRVAATKGCYVVGGDAEPGFIDVEEATLVEATPFISRIGKGLSHYTHVDVGVHSIELNILHGYRVVSGKLPLSSIVAKLAEKTNCAVIADVSGLEWTEIDTPRDLEELVSGRRRRVLDVVLEWIKA